MTFEASIVPISVPALPSSASADQLATFNAQMASNIIATGNSLLSSYIDLKETDFYQVGDLPEIWQQWYSQDTANYQRFNERPDTLRPAITFADIDNAINQLAALAPPNAPDIAAISGTTPELDATAPVLNFPAQPDTTLPTAPTGEPNIVEPGLPDAPAFTLPEVPTFDDLQLPSPPALSVPSFDEVAPTFNLAPYTGDFSYVDPGYTSELRDELVQKLLQDLTYGSYGIEVADETRLWARARDRAASVARREIAEVQRRAAATSFPMPQGAFYDAVEQAEQKNTNALSEANSQIFLKRSDMYVEGRKFTFAQVQQYETMAQNLYNAQQERALNYSKAVVEMGIAIYRSSLEQFNAQMQAYAVRAQVFSERVRAELAKASIFKTQVEAESLRVEFDKAKIQQYLAQLQGIQTVVDLYKAQLSATGLLVQVQAQKIGIFKSQLQVYSERLRAKEAEYNIYLASTRGELAKVEVYKSQIDAFNATLSGVETQARVKLQSNEALLQQYRTESANYVQKLETTKRLIDARIEEAKTQTGIYATDIDSYRALTASSSAAQSTLLDWGRLQQSFLVAQNRAAQENVRFRLKQLENSVNLQTNVNQYGIEYLRAGLGAAVSGLNSLGVKTGEE